MGPETEIIKRENGGGVEICQQNHQSQEEKERETRKWSQHENCTVASKYTRSDLSNSLVLESLYTLENYSESQRALIYVDYIN